MTPRPRRRASGSPRRAYAPARRAGSSPRACTSRSGSAPRRRPSRSRRGRCSRGAPCATWPLAPSSLRLSARPGPRSSRSVYGRIVWLRSSACGWYALVVTSGRWQLAQPMSLNTSPPRSTAARRSRAAARRAAPRRRPGFEALVGELHARGPAVVLRRTAVGVGRERSRHAHVRVQRGGRLVRDAGRPGLVAEAPDARRTVAGSGTRRARPEMPSPSASSGLPGEDGLLRDRLKQPQPTS